MADFSLRIIKKEEIARETMAIHFAKPEGFEYRAGQYAKFTIINPPETDTEGNSRVFSLASAPLEKDLIIATRLRDSAFKRVLRNLSVGSEIKMEGPHGDFVLPGDPVATVVFLIGGIGITPVRSMIAQATLERSPQKILLLYSNRTEKDAAFMGDLDYFAGKNKHFTFVPAITGDSAAFRKGETGRVTKEMLRKYVPDVNLPRYYFSGPGGMVTAMRQMLINAGVGEGNIRTEEFPGYG